METLYQQLATLSPEQRTLFEQKLAQRGMQPPRLGGIPRRQSSENLPLSFAQQRLWFIQKLDPDNTAYNIASALRLKGALDIAVLEQTLNALVERHETLRTTFETTPDNQPIQVIHPFQPLVLPVVDLQNATDVEADMRQRIEQLTRQPFDLTQPLLRLLLLRLSECEHVLVLATHHIISDRWSVMVFLREMTVLYRSFASGQPSPLPPLPIQYADWAIWQRQQLQGEKLKMQLDYWTTQLGGELPVLELPCDRPRPAVPTYRGAQYPIALAADLMAQLKTLSARSEVTLFTVLLAAFQVLLHRYTNSNDIVVGSEIANRHRSETEGLIGLFVNTLVLRTDLSGNPCFGDLLVRVREVLMGALAHQDLPFEQLVEVLAPERHLSQMMPLFQVKFDLQQVPVQPLELGGVTVERHALEEHGTKYELRFSLQDSDRGIRGQVEYSTDLFDEHTIARMVEHFQVLLAGIVTQPEQTLSELPLLTVSERQTLLIDWNQTQRAFPTEDCIHRLFEAQAERTPEAVAVQAGGQTVCYGELNAQANQVAHYLRAHGVGAEGVVGVCLERSVELLVGLLGVMKAGGAYLPLDPTLPPERLAFMLAEAQVALVLTQQQVVERVAAVIERRVVCLDTEWDQIAPYATTNLAEKIAPEQLAYVIYTSGSTGRPKGAMNMHRAICNRLLWMQETYQLTPADRVLQKTPFSFDVSVWEFFWPLIAGARLVMAQPGGHQDSAYLVELITEQQITTLHFVPSMLRVFLAAKDIEKCNCLKRVICSGEVLPYDLQQRFFTCLQADLHNLYGPTEAAVDVTFWACQRDSERQLVPIGRPVANTRIYIVDANLQPVPIGVPGELCTGGTQVARGYLNRPELTAEKFVPDPFGAEPGTRLYRTGDLARFLPDGNIEFLGRLDDQVKIRGYRIETGEIEAVLSQHPGVRETVVVAHRDDAADDTRLVAYVAAHSTLTSVSSTKTSTPLPAGSSTPQWRQFLAERLPAYMVPNIFLELGELPRLPSGKIDRRALPAPETERPALAGTYVKPRTRAETILADIWCRELNIRQVGVHDNFFELGGHSLLAIKIVAQAEAALERAVPLRYLFQAPTIAAFAALIETSGTQVLTAAERPTLMPAPEARYAPFPLTDIQQAYLLGRSQAFELGNVATHGYREIDTVGLTVGQMERAFNRLIERHDMLRAVVTPDGQQQVLPEVMPFVMQVTDLRGATSEQVVERLAAIRERLSHQMFSPERWPLFHIEATQLADNKVRFHVSFDVLIGDAWSFQLLGWEFVQLLQGGELPPLTLSFRDYVLAVQTFQETPAYQNDLAYWQNRLPTLPAAPELPLAVAPGTIEQPRFVRRSGTLDVSTWNQLKLRANQAQLTPSGLLLAAFAEILAMWSRHPQFTLNLTLFNRLPLHPEVNRLVGDFTSSMLLAIDNAGQEPFITRTRRIQTQLWEALEHRSVSGVRVLRELARTQQRVASALMPVVFTSTLGQTMPQAATERSWHAEVVYSVSQTSQVYLDHQVAEIAGALIFNWDAVAELFPDGLLDEMFQAYSELLERLADDATLWHAAPQLRLFAPRLHHVAALNQTAAQLLIGEREPLLHTLFFEQAQQQPGGIAVISADATLTYGELNQRVQHLAHRLRQLQVQPNQLVAIAMEKGWEQVVAALAILTAGAAYVPIDAELPEERRWHLIEATHATILLTQSHLDRTLIWPESLTRLCVDEVGPAADLVFPATPVQQPTDLAYVIYTSGSTGLPKGVEIDHRGAVNTVLDINQRFAVQQGDRVFGLSSLSFDLSVYDIFGTLAAGATLVIPAAHETRNPAHWLQLLAQHRVTVWNSVPALMQLLMDELQQAHDSSRVDTLRLAMLSGDWIPLSLPERITARCPSAQVVSLGGATEASIWSIYYPITAIDPNWKSIPYGRPLANQQWYVLNDDLEPCPVWVIGELYIAGKGLARGYWRNPKKTQASFITHPRTQERLYKTGDLGRYLPDGTIEFLGREDFQVKINGYRVELGEIETVLQQHPAIQSAVVVAAGESRDAQQLVAYVVPSENLSNLTSGKPVHVLNDPFARLDFKLQRRGLRAMPQEQISVELPLPEPDQTQPYLRRQSYRRFLEEPIALLPFSQFLGCLRSLRLGDSPLPKYRYASAGSLYPVQTYLNVKPLRIAGLNGGFYYYDPEAHRLVRVTDSEGWPESAVGEVYGINQPLFEQAAFSIFLVAQLQAITPIYGEQAHDFCLLEAGYMGQLLMETAPESNLGLCPIAGLGFEPLQQVFDLGDDHRLLHGFVGGAIDPAWTQQWLPPATPRSTVSIAETLRQYLHQKLPAYMVPTSYHLLESLPLSSNGKVDRQALPKPSSLTPEATPYAAPRNELEQIITDIWQNVLKLDRVSIHENFFEAGGNSLSVIQVMSQLRQMFQVELSIRQFFMAPTPAEQAEAIAAQRQNVAQPGTATDDAIERIEREDAPLLLDRLDELSEQEVDALLRQTLTEEEGQV